MKVGTRTHTQLKQYNCTIHPLKFFSLSIYFLILGRILNLKGSYEVKRRHRKSQTLIYK